MTRACRLVGLSRSSFKYKAKEDSSELVEQIKDIAKENQKWGYRLLLSILRRKGLTINHKKFLRIYREKHLQIRIRPHKQKEHRQDRVKSDDNLTGINERWSMDFIHDVLANKRQYRILNVIDDYNRKSLVAQPRRSFGGYDVGEYLDIAIKKYGKPQIIKSDNGSEFKSRYMQKWAKDRGIILEFSRPGTPTDNARVESFNGTMRAELLRTIDFETLNEVKEYLTIWQRKYNEDRPHSSLGYLSPNNFSARPLGSDRDNKLLTKTLTY